MNRPRAGGSAAFHDVVECGEAASDFSQALGDHQLLPEQSASIVISTAAALLCADYKGCFGSSVQSSSSTVVAAAAFPLWQGSTCWEA